MGGGILGNKIYLDHKLIEQKQLNISEIFKSCGRIFLVQFSGVKDVVFFTTFAIGAWTPTIDKIKIHYNPIYFLRLYG